MPTQLNAFSSLQNQLLPEIPSDIALEDLHKRRFFQAFLLIVNFGLLGFGLPHLTLGNYWQAAFDLGIWFNAIIILIVIRRVRKPIWAFRYFSLMVTGLFFWDALQGGPHGSRLFWFLLLPPFNCFLFGMIEGTIYSVTGGLILAVFLHGAMPGVAVYDYPDPVKLRFFITYYVITLSALMYEKARDTIECIQKQAHTQIVTKQHKLERIQQALKKANRRLKHTKARLHHAQAMAHVGSWEYDLESGRIELSRETRRICGIAESLGSVPIKTAKHLIPDGPNLFTTLEKLLHFDEPFDTEFPANRFSDDHEIILHAKAELIRDQKGNPVKVFGIVQDITRRKTEEEERKRIALQLQQAQKMEAIGTLAGGVAHDLNNILAGILSYPDLLLRQIPAGHPLQDPLNTIKNSGEKAAAIVQDLLTLARRNVATRQAVNLNTIITDYLSSPEFKRLKDYHPGVRIETRLEPALLNIMGSAVHLGKAIMNLVSNAAEAMPDGGIITIRTDHCPNGPQTGPSEKHKAPRVHPLSSDGYRQRHHAQEDEANIVFHARNGARARADQTEQYVRLRVQDQGMGIQPEDVKRIFEPFFTKKSMGRSGTGLGMAVVWETVQDHEGHIHINSTPDTGTIFTLYFPVTHAIAPQPSDMKNDGRFPKGRGETILIVDDRQEQRMIASSILAELGYRTAEAQSGESALEWVRKKKPDLVLLDMIMKPGICGLETYKRIVGLYPDQSVIIASGNAKTEKIEQALALGACAYLKKPYTMEAIATAVHSALV